MELLLYSNDYKSRDKEAVSRALRAWSQKKGLIMSLDTVEKITIQVLNVSNSRPNDRHSKRLQR